MKFTGKTIKNILLGLIPFLAILFIWYGLYFFGDKIQWLIPSPTEVMSTFVRLAIDGTFIDLVMVSILNLIPAFIVALVLAIILGIEIGINKTVYKIFYPILSVIYSIPSLAWLPFVVLTFGFTRGAIWFVIFISSFLRIVYNIISGVQNINIDYILVGRNLGFNKPAIFLKIILPCILPQIITGARIGFGSAWRSLIGAEMLVATLGGLGKFIWTAQWFFSFDKVISGIMVIALVSIFVENIILLNIEKRTLIKWGSIREKSL